MAYTTADIRSFLMERYDDEELTTLCFDYFRTVHADFAVGMTKRHKVQLLLDYCIKHDAFPNLVAALERTRPDAWPPGATSLAQDQSLAPSQPSTGSLEALRPRLPSPKFQKRLSTRSMALIAVGLITLVACLAIGLIVADFRKTFGSLPSLGIRPTPTTLVRPSTTVTATRLLASTATPALLYRSGLVAYVSQDERKNRQLYALRPDGVAITLTQAYSDVVVLSISPDSRYLALAVCNQGTLGTNAGYPRFWGGKPGTDLIVVSVDSQKQNTAVYGPSAFSASYLSDGQLFIALLEKSTVTYYMSGTDGTGRREVYRSINKLFTPTAIATGRPSQ